MTDGVEQFKEEDYRWPIVRRNLPKWAMHILSLTFIAFIQNFLLLSTSLPQVFLLLTRSRAPVLGMPDYLLAGLTVSLLVIEQIADSQQQSMLILTDYKMIDSGVLTAPQDIRHGNALRKLRKLPLATHLRRRQRRQSLPGDSIPKDCGDGVDTLSVVATRSLCGLNLTDFAQNFTCEQLHWYSLYLFTLRITLQDEVVQQSLEFINQTAVSVQADRTVDWSAVKQFLIEARQSTPNLLKLFRNIC